MKKHPLHNKVISFTGLPCSGKSTIAKALFKMLYDQGHMYLLLDADDIRKDLWPELKYSPEDREENLRRFTSLAKRVSDTGIGVILALIAPYEVVRDKMRSILGEKFIEVFVDTPLSICEERDVKGMYKKARAGEIKEFTGLDAPFERPKNPDVICQTTDSTPEDEAEKIIDYLLEHAKILDDGSAEEREQKVQDGDRDSDSVNNTSPSCPRCGSRAQQLYTRLVCSVCNSDFALN